MSQSTQQPATECPACTGTDIEMNAYDYASLCADCGLVISATGEPSISDAVSPDMADEDTRVKSLREIYGVTNDTERRILDAFETIEDIDDCLPIPIETRIEAADIFLAAFRDGHTDSRERTCFVTACVRLASVSTSTPIPTDRLIDAVDGIHSKQFHRHRRVIASETDMEMSFPTPADYVWFLEATDTITDTADSFRQLLDSAVETKGLVGKDPAGIAAAGAYVVDDALKQATAADAMGVSTETIRRRSKVLREVLADD